MNKSDIRVVQMALSNASEAEMATAIEQISQLSTIELLMRLINNDYLLELLKQQYAQRYESTVSNLCFRPRCLNCGAKLRPIYFFDEQTCNSTILCCNCRLKMHYHVLLNIPFQLSLSAQGFETLFWGIDNE